MSFFDYALLWCAEIFSRTYNHKTERTGLEHLTGDMPNISEWLEFDLYTIRSGFGTHHIKRKLQDPAADWVCPIESDLHFVIG